MQNQVTVQPLSEDLYYAVGEWSPQAIFTRQIEQIVQPGLEMFASCDDLDNFRCIAAIVGDMPMAVINYRGFPNGATSLYLPFEVTDEAVIAAQIEIALKVFGIDRSEVTWERKDGLDDQKA